MEERLERFEKMLEFIQNGYMDTMSRMERLRKEGKTSSVTYKQLMAEKLKLEDMLSIYRLHDLID